MARFIKMYITTEDVSKQITEPYTGKEIAFTNTRIAQDGSAEFTAVLTDESMDTDINPHRTKFELNENENKKTA